MYKRFEKRAHAGWSLGEYLKFRRLPGDLITVGIARGGVPVAVEVAKALDAPLDVLAVGKLRMPDAPELSFGAVTASGETALDENLVRHAGLTKQRVGDMLRSEKARVGEWERAHNWVRADPVGEPEDWTNRTILLVDDGMARGMTMLAAIRETRRRGASRVLVAVPVASLHAVRTVEEACDGVMCLRTPEPFGAVREWYWDFPEMTDFNLRDAATRSLYQSA